MSTALKSLAEKITTSSGAQPFSLTPDIRQSIGDSLDSYLDTLAAGHTSSHQNNHSSSPDRQLEAPKT